MAKKAETKKTDDEILKQMIKGPDGKERRKYYYKEHRVNGILHREPKQGPAVEAWILNDDGTFKEGQVHAEFRLNGRLHNPFGRALYKITEMYYPVVDFVIDPIERDFYTYKNIEIPKEWTEGSWVKDKKTHEEKYVRTSMPSPKEIMKLQNADQRMAAMEMYGVVEFIQQVEAKQLDSDVGERDAFRELYELPRGVVNYRVLLCTDGSTNRIYWMAVPSTCNTVSEAARALNGVEDQKLLAES